jgi:hypothetical protein
VYGASCATAAFCVAVDGKGRALGYDGHAWGQPVTIDSQHQLNSVACPSVTLCVAVDGNGDVVTFNGTSWTSPAAVDPGNGLVGVACGSPTFCVTVDTAGNAITYNGSAWSSPVHNSVAGGFRGISCASGATVCQVTDFDRQVFTFNGSAWSTGTSLNGALNDISCGSSQFCEVVGGSGASAYRNGAWGTRATIDRKASLSAVACTATSFCAAGDSRGNALVTLDGTAWTAPADVDGTRGFDAMSCPSAVFCAGVDAEGYAVTYSDGPPVDVSLPVVSGTGAVGQQLACSTGAWTGKAPLSFSYQWLREGAAIAGASSSSYTVAAADAGSQVSCRVSASNSLGGAAATSAPTTIPAVPPSAGIVKLTKAIVKGRSATLHASCSGGAACSLKLSLTVVETHVGSKLVAVTARKSHRHKKPKRRKRVVTVGSAAKTISSGQSQVVTVPLNGTGKSLLASRHKLKVKLTVLEVIPASQPDRVGTQILTFHAPASKRHTHARATTNGG